MTKRSLGMLAALLLASAGCSTTGPNTQVAGLWGYNAGTMSDNEVVCSIAIPMILSQADTNFSGTFAASYMSCSSAIGASSTIANGTVSGTVSLTSLTVSFQNTASYNYGAIEANVTGHTGVGTHLTSQATYEGTATMQVTIAGIPHTLTGTWVAKAE